MPTGTHKLTGKVAVITGGSSGIRLATVRRFVAEGAHVYITGRRQKELDATVEARFGEGREGATRRAGSPEAPGRPSGDSGLKGLGGTRVAGPLKGEHAWLQ